MSEITVEKNPELLRSLLEEVIETSRFYGVKVTKEKSFMDLYKEIVMCLELDTIIEVLKQFGHTEDGLIGEMNSVLKSRLQDLDDKEKAASVPTPAANTH